jgi:hypothetical protein
MGMAAPQDPFEPTVAVYPFEKLPSATVTVKVAPVERPVSVPEMGTPPDA